MKRKKRKRKGLKSRSVKRRKTGVNSEKKLIKETKTSSEPTTTPASPGNTPSPTPPKRTEKVQNVDTPSLDQIKKPVADVTPPEEVTNISIKNNMLKLINYSCKASWDQSKLVIKMFLYRKPSNMEEGGFNYSYSCFDHFVAHLYTDVGNFLFFVIVTENILVDIKFLSYPRNFDIGKYRIHLIHFINTYFLKYFKSDVLDRFKSTQTGPNTFEIENIRPVNFFMVPTKIKNNLNDVKFKCHNENDDSVLEISKYYYKDTTNNMIDGVNLSRSFYKFKVGHLYTDKGNFIIACKIYKNMIDVIKFLSYPKSIDMKKYKLHLLLLLEELCSPYNTLVGYFNQIGCKYKIKKKKDSEYYIQPCVLKMF